jgi:hypothetical protein
MSNNNVEEVVSQVTSRKEAEVVVARLLNRFGSDTAWNTVEAKAAQRKKSVQEVTRQTVRNLFTTFTTNRYSK